MEGNLVGAIPVIHVVRFLARCNMRRRMAYNGTSMSSPQVTNLASKLLALNPDLSTTELRRLLIDGADEVDLGERTIRLMNPQASLALMQQNGS